MQIILDTSNAALKVLRPVFLAAAEPVRVIRQDGGAFDDSQNYRVSLFSGAQILAYADLAVDGIGDYALYGQIDTHTDEAVDLFAAAGNPEQLRCAATLQTISEATAPLELLGRAETVIRYNGTPSTTQPISGSWYYGAADCTQGSDVVAVSFGRTIAAAPDGVISLTVAAPTGAAQITASVEGAITTTGFTARLTSAAGAGYKIYWMLTGAM